MTIRIRTMKRITKTDGKRAIFFDLDGTLMTEDLRIDPHVYKELERVKAQGHKLFINTGRSKAHVPQIIREDPIFDGIICGSAYIEYKGDILMNRTLSAEAKKQVFEFADKNQMPVLFEGVSKNYFYLFNKKPTLFCIGVDISKEDFLSEKEEVTKVSFCKVIAGMDTSGITELRVIEFKTYGEGIINGCDKAKAMNQLLELIGVPKEQTVSFGDSENDIEMLRNSDIAVVMPHGAEKAKAEADLVMTIDQALKEIFE
ncbi:MAG: HAD-IIB family hydrolase [Ruminococcaceae bacterium]|nr:HAD-IIB family hydrolase [Oscillospiraceae bacterium]